MKTSRLTSNTNRLSVLKLVQQTRSRFLQCLIPTLLVTTMGASTAVNAGDVGVAAVSVANVNTQVLAEANGQNKVEKVNLNTATAEELAAGLRGVGKARAEAIVALREELGGFTDIEQLLQVRGLGMKVINDNRDKLSL
ncbi:MAG: helix-hairpin-helix domain-containing protein [Aliidiomarina sp.]|uniref:ComEA family DNA-binding protein n=1 Tax=Aliidiomarina sp. TaxID=1872439 RepID=UPI0025C36B7C|nr:helix-hairpin-helix domain-containing protein [Aliidiomarina sp.]MCH8500331.1 helix-hairpin-helix domain-containing protein [Aliidiomarina sp.]